MSAEKTQNPTTPTSPTSATSSAPQSRPPTAVGADVPPPSTKLKIHHVTIGRMGRLLAITLALVSATACSRSAPSPEKIDEQNAALNYIPAVTGPSIDPATVPGGQTRWVSLSNGAEIPVLNRKGKLIFEGHGTFSEAAFRRLKQNLSHLDASERDARIGAEIRKIFQKMGSIGATGLRLNEKAGYFRFQAPYSQSLLKDFEKIGLKGVILNPVTPDRSAIERLSEVTPRALGLEPLGKLNATPAGYSGLERMGAIEFTRLAENDIGGSIRVDGSSVKIGITDTGITYNHPTFRTRKAPARSRVEGMRDFTREGRVYFHPTARFEVAAGEDAGTLSLTAEVIVTPSLPFAPSVDELALVENLPIKPSDELRTLLLAEGQSGARFGVLLEKSISTPSEPVDLNGNGTSEDQIPVILIPGASPADDRLFVNFTADGDFRTVRALKDFNTSGMTASVFAERIGFDIRTDTLESGDGNALDVRSASVVGYDPGNHGTHVAGIAAGMQTLSNDSADTLARGAAPEARIFSGRVCSNAAGCNATAAFVELVTANNVDVVNMSLGGLSPFNDGYDVEETLINRFVESGLVQFMISAGNSGPGKQTVGSPSVANRALSIGATATRQLIAAQYQWPGLGASAGTELPGQDDDFLLFFSSRGPTAAGGFKPNITAPGTQLSSVQLNAAPGARGGLDVYWGTSMAAPAATGAYALLLDAVRKYNAVHPELALPSDSMSLREVILESARPFNVNTLRTSSGDSRQGRYTWVDEGVGMINLPGAWARLKALRDSRRVGPEGSPIAAVSLNGEAVELNYEVIYNQDLTPNAIPYDGSNVSQLGVPSFGTGVLVDFHGENTLLPVHINRQLPFFLAEHPMIGDLTAQLLTSRDEFELDVEIHGSQVEWLKAGALQQHPCWEGDYSNLSLIGRGAEVTVDAENKGQIIGFGASTLNVCINRERIENELSPGDHGALIRAYRRIPMADADGRVTGYRRATTASFIVPVHLVVPARTLDGETTLAVDGSVRSFEVTRNYIKLPKGVSTVRVTLEVPELKKDARGRTLPGQQCSGVELTSMEGLNTIESFPRAADARATNCGLDGRASSDKSRKVELVRLNPNAGLWDIHVMGLFRYSESAYKLRVDYVTGKSSIQSIEGVAGELAGSFTWTKVASSLDIRVSEEKSGLILTGLKQTLKPTISQGETLIIDGPTGALRTYPAEVEKVEFRTGGALGSDIDLRIARCAVEAEDLNHPSCELAGSSAGGTATELVTIKPEAGFAYAVIVDGYAIAGGQTEFESSETLLLKRGKETYPLSISWTASSTLQVGYRFGAEELATSALAHQGLFINGSYALSGSIQLKNEDGLPIEAIPLTLSHGAAGDTN